MDLKDEITEMADDSYVQGATDICDAILMALQTLIDNGASDAITPTSVVKMVEQAKVMVARDE